MQDASREFPAETENVRAARLFVSETAEKWNLGELAWPLVQIVSELASNAIIHAATEFTVCLSYDGDATRVEVVDRSPRRAQMRGYDVDATTGRGLRLVEMLSREWGVSTNAKGKSVWAVIDATTLLDAEPEVLAELFLEVTDDVAPASSPPSKARGRRRPRASSVLAA